LANSTLASDLDPQPFGKTTQGHPATLYTLQNEHLRVQVMDYCARLVSIETADRAGSRGEVLLGFADVQSYVSAGESFGAVLGRNANRIAGGVFTLEGRTYRLTTNDRGSTLHGGTVGFGDVFWTVISSTCQPMPSLVMRHVSPDGDQGFPGQCTVLATYHLEGDCLWLELEAQCTRPTPLSLSAHPYFNLSGPQSPHVLDHRITIAADTFLPTDDKQIPTGELCSVAGTPFDFRSPRALGERIRQPDAQLLHGQGYDHYFVLPDGAQSSARLAARALDPVSGRMLEIYCTQPGLQLYSGNQLRGAVAGRGGIYRQSAGLAFEPQEYPDAVHHRHFPASILMPGRLYSARIGYRFRSVV